MWLSGFIGALTGAGGRVLEVGCGRHFADAAVLAENGLNVFACDLNLPQAPRDPSISAFVADISRPLPVRTSNIDAVLASLSLHYFPWSTTMAVFDEIHRVLRPGGVVVFRVNATDDFEHGAGVGEEVEPGYFVTEVDGGAQRKHFFDEAALRKLLARRFTIQHLRHTTTYRFGTTKRVWECVAISEIVDETSTSSSAR